MGKKKTLTKRQQAHRKYLQSEDWAQVRVDLLIEVGFQCERCKSKRNLQVHHLNYDRFGGDELRDDLIVLCSYHHRLEHNLIKTKHKQNKSKNKKKNKRNRRKTKHGKVTYISVKEYLATKK